MTWNLRRHLATGCGGLALAAMCLAVAGPFPAPAAAAAPQTITIAVAETPDTLDPQLTGAALVRNILYYVGDTLVIQNPFTKAVVPDLATRWTTSANGLTYRFFLRHDVKFQDGTPFNARAMAFTLDRAMNPATHANIAASLLAPVKSVKVLGPYTLQIVLKYPYAPFLSTALSDPSLMAISPTAVAKEKAKFAQDPVGTGPLMVKQYVAGKSLTLVRNPNYRWAPAFYKNRGPVKFKKLVFDFLPDSATIVNGLKTGEITLSWPAAVTAIQAAQFKGNAHFQVIKTLHNGLTSFLIMNFKVPALKSLKVRRAINYAINKEAVIKLALNGNGVAAYSPLPPTLFGYDPASVKYGYHYNPAKAKQLLDAAGYKMGPNGYRVNARGQALNFTLYTAENPPLGTQVVQQDLQAVGIQATIKSMDVGTVITDMEHGQQDLGMMGYTYNDPDVLYLFFDSASLHGGLNMSQYSSPALDHLFLLGREAVNTSRRAQIYREVQKYMVANAVIVPIYTAEDFTVAEKIPGLKVANSHVLLQDVH